MDFLTSFVKSVIKPRFEEDSVDRLNYQFTVWILVIFATFISAKEYFGAPIQCWVPAEFIGAWEQYVENYCFVESTYYVALHQDIHMARNAPQGPPKISYYQWVPFVLALQALMFFLPHMLWRMLNWQSGINVRSVISMACDKNIGKGQFESAVETISGHMKKSIEMEKAIRLASSGNPLNWIFGCGRASGWYITSLYLFVKSLWVVNIVAQFLILKDFLGISSNFWGFEIFADLASGKTWNHTGNFPRVTFCDFKVRTLANIQDRTVQCVLTINMFSEKIYLFVWWWFFLVAIITVLNFLYWVTISLSAASRQKFVKNLLILGDRTFDDDPVKAPAVDKFIQTLKPDGVFVLRLMCKNAGDVITFHILKTLFNHFYTTMQNAEPTRNSTVRASVSSAPVTGKGSYGKDIDKISMKPYPSAPSA